MSGASGTTESGCETWPIVRDYRRRTVSLSSPFVRMVAAGRGQTHGVWSCQVDLDGCVCSFRRRRRGDRVEQLLEDIFGEFEVDRAWFVCG